MTVNEAIRNIPKEDIVAIGMKSGYVYIGEAGRFFIFDRLISKEEKDRIVASMNKMQETIKGILAEGVKPFDKNELVLSDESETKVRITPKDYAKRIQHIGKQLQNAINYNEKMEKYLFNWKDFGNREVKKMAKTEFYGNIQIIAEGLEEGRFWMKDEFDEAYGLAKKETKKNAS